MLRGCKLASLTPGRETDGEVLQPTSPTSKSASLWQQVPTSLALFPLFTAAVTTSLALFITAAVTTCLAKAMSLPKLSIFTFPVCVCKSWRHSGGQVWWAGRLRPVGPGLTPRHHLPGMQALIQASSPFLPPSSAHVFEAALSAVAVSVLAGINRQAGDSSANHIVHDMAQALLHSMPPGAIGIPVIVACVDASCLANALPLSGPSALIATNMAVDAFHAPVAGASWSIHHTH